MKNWKYIEGAKTGNAGITDKEFNSENEMRRWCIEHNYTYTPVGGGYYRLEDDSGKNRKDLEAHLKAGNKTGNDTPWEYAHRKPKVINEDKTGAEEFFKKLSDDVKEREKKDDAEIKLVGNETYQHKHYPNKYVIIEGNNYKIVTDGKVEKSGKITDAVLYGINQTYKRVGNATPNYRYKDFLITNPEGHEYIVFLKDGRTVGYRGTTSKAQAEDWCDWHDPKTGKSIGNKVGNALNWDENLVGKFVWVKDKGQEWKVYVMQDKGDKVYIRDDDGSQGWVSKTRITGKVGNSKTGNAKTGNKKLKFTSKTDGKIEYVYDEESQDGFIYDDGKLVDTIKGAGQGWLNLIKQKAFSSGVLNKTGNSAQDDKFAYVMREFDEGKLKTPDGKVVTDPAQAKAIAYSESKKTENGLARARNAMAGNGLLDTVLSKTKHIKRFGVGSKVQAEGETGTVVKETVEVGPNGIPFGWVTVKFSDGKTRQYYDYDLKK